jgi:glycosyltransferase 2 family protein
VTTNITQNPVSKNPASKRRSRWGTLIIFLLAALLLFLAFRGANWEEMLTTVQQGHIERLLAAFGSLSFSYLLRSLRWRVLLTADRDVSPLTALWGTAAGYLGNAVLPARAGEIIRSVLIGRKTGIPISYVLATALTERVMDVIALVLFGSLALTAVGTIPDWLIGAAKVMTIVGLVGTGIFFILPRLEKLMIRLLDRVPLSSTLKTKGTDLLHDFLTGIRAIQSIRRGGAFAGLTVLIWSCDILTGLLVMSSFNLVVTPAQMMILLAALGLSSAAPSTPGYVGIYQFVAVTVLVPFGLSQNQALIYIIAFQAVTYVVVIIWGGLGLWRLNASRQLPTSLSDSPDS